MRIEEKIRCLAHIETTASADGFLRPCSFMCCRTLAFTCFSRCILIRWATAKQPSACCGRCLWLWKFSGFTTKAVGCRNLVLSAWMMICSAIMVLRMGITASSASVFVLLVVCANAACFYVCNAPYGLHRYAVTPFPWTFAWSRTSAVYRDWLRLSRRIRWHCWRFNKHKIRSVRRIYCLYCYKFNSIYLRL